jgi:fumarate reductase flavoprotein subunit
MRKGLLLLFVTAIFLSSCFTTRQVKPDSGSALKDGVYIGEEPGWPDMKVEVTIQNDRIRNVRFLESNGTRSYTEMIIPVLPDRVIHANSTDVEGVTGATLSCDSFLSAVRDALGKAR